MELFGVVLTNAASAGQDNLSLSSPLLNMTEIKETNEQGEKELAKGYAVNIETIGDEIDMKKTTSRKLETICSHYKEAAIYLHEGIKNEKFVNHPSSLYSYYGYIIIHHQAYYLFIPFIALLLLLLTLVEQPTFVNIPLKVTPLIELLLLVILSIDVALTVMWHTPKNYLRKRLIVLKCILLFLSILEAIVILARNNQSFHITRILRPVFLLDTLIMTDVKRVIHHIQKLLGPIIDILCFLFFVISLIGASGYYVFGSTYPLYRFRTLKQSMVNLFITIIQATYPLPLLDRYYTKGFSPVYIVTFVLWCMFVLSKVLLAVVNSSFAEVQRNKFKLHYLHRRNALRHAFELLQSNGSISFSSYVRMMYNYSPKASVWRILCTYKSMIHVSGSLRLEEFYSFYDVQKLHWRRIDINGKVVRWYSHFSPFIADKLDLLTKMVTHQFFRITMNIIVFTNLVYFYELTTYVGKKDPNERLERPQELVGVNLAFVAVYMLEAIIKMTALGPLYYFHSYWNVFDFCVTNISFVVDITQMFHPEVAFLIPIRFIRLIRFNERFRKITNTMAQLMPRILSMFILFLILYYLFAVIGMEAFNHEIHRGCCNTTSIGRYYSGDPNETNVHYYTLSFNSLPQSYVTLFEVMVGANWWIVMEGVTTAEHNENTRAYFLAFMISTTVLFTVSLSFILQAFVFQVQFDKYSLNPSKKIKHEKNGGIALINEGEFLEIYKITLSKEDMIDMENEMTTLLISRRFSSAAMPDYLLFEGKRPKTKSDLLKQVYRDKLEKWTEEDRYQVLSLAQSSHYSTADGISPVFNVRRKLTLVCIKILQTIKAILVYVFV